MVLFGELFTALAAPVGSCALVGDVPIAHGVVVISGFKQYTGLVFAAVESAGPIEPVRRDLEERADIDAAAGGLFQLLIFHFNGILFLFSDGVLFVISHCFIFLH